MLKLTRTKSGMSILTVKAFGFYANVSCGKSAKAKRIVRDARPSFAFDYLGAAACAVLAFSAFLTF